MPRYATQAPETTQVLEDTERIINLHGLFSNTEERVPQAWIQTRAQCDWETLTRAIEYLRDRLGAPLEAAGADTPEERTWRYRPEEAARYQLPGLWPDVWKRYWENPDLEAQHCAVHYGGRKRMVSAGLHAWIGDDGFKMRLRRVLRCMQTELDDVRLLAFGRVCEALLDRRPLRFDDAADVSVGRGEQIRPGIGRSIEHLVSVQCLNLHHGHWTLDVQAHGSPPGKLQAVSFERVLAPQVLVKALAVDADEASLRAHQDDCYRAVPAPARKRTGALLRFDPWSARWGADERWHPDQHLHFRADGSVDLRVPDTALEPLLRDLLKHPLEVEVLAPKALAAQHKKQFGALLTAGGKALKLEAALKKKLKLS